MRKCETATESKKEDVAKTKKAKTEKDYEQMLIEMLEKELIN